MIANSLKAGNPKTEILFLSHDHEVTWQVQGFQSLGCVFLRNKKILEPHCQIAVNVSKRWNFKFSSSHVKNSKNV